MRLPGLVSAALILAFGLLLVGIGWSAAPGGGQTEASLADERPIACENLIEATKLFAAGGTVEAPNLGVAEGGLDTIHSRRYETLRRLLDACDSQLAAVDAR